MFAIITLLLVVTLSILVTRIATIALVHTGLSRESARFQARSAFSGAGFTTSESEGVVNHPVRRRIVMLLMLLGNAGIITAVSSLVLTFVHRGESGSLALKIILLVMGLVSLWIISQSAWVDRRLSSLIDKLLKRYTQLDVRDYASLMHLAGDYRLAELEVDLKDWIADRTLAETELRKEGFLVLGIKRSDGSYLGAPLGSSKILPNDVLIVYGRVSEIERIDQRRKNKRGDREHLKAIEEQKKVVEEEIKEDSAAKPEL